MKLSDKVTLTWPALSKRLTTKILLSSANELKQVNQNLQWKQKQMNWNWWTKTCSENGGKWTETDEPELAVKTEANELKQINQNLQWKERQTNSHTMRQYANESLSWSKWSFLNRNIPSSVQFSPLTDRVVGRTRGTIQQRFSSCLFCRRPLWAALAWAGMSTLWHSIPDTHAYILTLTVFDRPGVTAKLTGRQNQLLTNCCYGCYSYYFNYKMSHYR